MRGAHSAPAAPPLPPGAQLQLPESYSGAVVRREATQPAGDEEAGVAGTVWHATATFDSFCYW